MEPKKSTSVATNVRWKPEFYKKLEKAAKETGFSKVSTFVKFAMNQYLKDHE
jgi:predicted HicB family RNase H-like nuclease